MSSSASKLTAPQRIFIGFLLGLFVLFGAVVSGLPVIATQFVLEYAQFVWANFPKLYPLIALVGGLLWSGHVAMRRPLDGKAVDFVGGSFLVALTALYLSLGKDIMQLAQSPVYLAALYTSLSVLLFPFALATVQATPQIDKEGLLAAMPALGFPVMWICTSGEAFEAGLTGTALYVVVTVNVVSNLATLGAAYLYLKASERQASQDQARNRLREVSRDLGEVDHAAS